MEGKLADGAMDKDLSLDPKNPHKNQTLAGHIYYPCVPVREEAERGDCLGAHEPDSLLYTLKSSKEP